MLRPDLNDPKVAVGAIVPAEVARHWRTAPTRPLKPGKREKAQPCDYCFRDRRLMKDSSVPIRSVTHYGLSLVATGGTPGTTPEAIGTAVAFSLGAPLENFMYDRYCAVHAEVRAREAEVPMVETLEAFLALGAAFRQRSYLDRGDGGLDPAPGPGGALEDDPGEALVLDAATLMALGLKTPRTTWKEIFREMEGQGLAPAFIVEGCLATGLMTPYCLRRMAEHFRIPLSGAEGAARLKAWVSRASHEARKFALESEVWHKFQTSLQDASLLAESFAHGEGGDPKGDEALADLLMSWMRHPDDDPVSQKDDLLTGTWWRSARRLVFRQLAAWPTSRAADGMIAFSALVPNGMVSSVLTEVLEALLRHEDPRCFEAAVALLQTLVAEGNAKALAASSPAWEGGRALESMLLDFLREASRKPGSRKVVRFVVSKDWPRLALWLTAAAVRRELAGQDLCGLGEHLEERLEALRGSIVNATNSSVALRAEAAQAVAWCLKNKPSGAPFGPVKALRESLKLGIKDRSTVNKEAAKRLLEEAG